MLHLFQWILDDLNLIGVIDLSGIYNFLNIDNLLKAVGLTSHFIILFRKGKDMPIKSGSPYLFSVRFFSDMLDGKRFTLR
jgi:hypothetical protein